MLQRLQRKGVAKVDNCFQLTGQIDAIHNHLSTTGHAVSTQVSTGLTVGDEDGLIGLIGSNQDTLVILVVGILGQIFNTGIGEILTDALCDLLREVPGFGGGFKQLLFLGIEIIGCQDDKQLLLAILITIIKRLFVNKILPPLCFEGDLIILTYYAPYIRHLWGLGGWCNILYGYRFL